MMTPEHHGPQAEPHLAAALDQAVAALTVFDVSELEAIEKRIHLVTARHLAGSRESFPELLQKRALLAQLLDATAANLKVLVSVLNLEARTETR